MRLLVASDLHGSAHACRALLQVIDREQPDVVLLLGDLLYHGPRNPLPQDYDPQAVVGMLNPLKDRLLCVRGNCDAEVDQMLLHFPMRSDYAMLYCNGVRILATHGHLGDDMLPAGGYEVRLQGHTHLPRLQVEGGILWGNPGSLALPKENTPAGYLLLEEGLASHKALDGTLLAQTPLQGD